MVVLPYDIWLHIGSFLSKAELWHLRFVNKAMYEMAMDRSHKEVVVSLSDHSHSKLHRRDFLRFMDQNLAKRVRELSFVYYDPVQFRISERELRTYPEKMGLKERFKHFLKGKNERSLVIETFAGFTRVQSFKAQWMTLWGKLLQDSIPLLRTSLFAAAGSVRSLDLSIPFENINDIIPPSLSLPRLSSFSMTIFGLEATDLSKIGRMFTDTAQTILVPLINHHRRTLTSFNLRLCHPRMFWSMVLPNIPTANFDITPMYKGLEHIPHLRSLGLSISRSTDLAVVVVPFLNMHTDTIRTLNLYLMDPTFQSSDVVFDRVKLQGCHFPNLDTLNIEYVRAPDSTPGPPQDMGSTPDFVVDHSARLTSLKLVGKPLSRDAVFAVLRPQGRTCSYERMGEMKVTLQSLTPELLTLFESALPNLEDLELSIRKFKKRHTTPEAINEEYQFSTEIGKQDYSSWSLKALTLVISNRRDGSEAKLERSHGALALASALTSLRTFNGVPRRQYLAQARALIEVNSVPGPKLEP